MKKFNITFLVIILFTSLIAAQTTYYVSFSQGNDNNTGTSPGSAWRTLARVDASWNSFNPGDSILFKRGDEWAPVTSTYLLRFPTDYGGTQNNYIVLGAYGSGPKPILSILNSSSQAGVRADGLHWMIIQDITFYCALTLRGHTNGVHDLKFFRLGFNGQPNGVDVTSHLWLQGVVFPTPTVGVYDHIEPVFNIEVGYCTFENCWDAGFQSNDALNLNVARENVWVHHNTFVNTRNRESVDIGGGNDMTIEYNKIYGGTSNFSGMKIHAQYHTLKNLVFRGNEIIVQSDVIPLTVYGAQDSWIYNNTLAHNTNMPGGASHAGLYMGARSSGHAQIFCSEFVNTVVANNIVNGRVELVHATGFTTTYNLSDDGFNTNIVWSKTWTQVPLPESNFFYNNHFYNEGVASRRVRIIREYSRTGQAIDITFGEGDIQAWLDYNNVSDDSFSDPLFSNLNFTSPTNPGNYIPINGSPVLGSGYIIPGYIFDIDGNPVPVGSPPDRGAHQVTAVVTPTDELRVFLQGAYVNGSMRTDLNTSQIIPLTQPYNSLPWNYNGNEAVSSVPNNVVDWIMLELRSNTTTTVTQRAAFVLNTGLITDLNGSSSVSFSNTPDGDYYLVVYHRNHLAIMSAVPITLSNHFMNFNFTNSLNNAYGSNPMAEIQPGVYGMFSGDSDANGTVDNQDFSSVAPNIFQTGYKAGDLDLNGIVNVLDYGKINQNLNKNTQVPSN